MENENVKFKIEKINDKNIWDNFVLSQPDYTFLNSWNWGEFNLEMGHKIWRLGIYSEKSNIKNQISKISDQKPNLIGAILVIKIQAKRGTFLFLPHNPLFCSGNSKFEIRNPKQILNLKFQIIFQYLIDYLKSLAKEEKCSFIRISPLLEDNEENRQLFKNLGFRPAPIHMHAEIMWLLDLEPPEEKLLADMRKTTRYLIRKSEKEGVEIFQKNDIEGVELFNRLYCETTERQHFTPFSLDYLKNEFASFNEDSKISAFFAKYQPRIAEQGSLRGEGEIIAGAIIVFYGNSAFYHHGASLMKYQKIPAAYLLQWEIIKEAKRKGLKFYNFWGIAPVFAEAKTGNSKFKIQNSKFSKHPWAGLTLFKTGFGGFQKDYLHAQDLPFNHRYWLNYLIEVIRRKKRGL